MAVSLFPDSIFKPFVEANLTQVVLIALLSGVCIVILDKRVTNLKNLVFEMQQFINKIVDIVMIILPPAIFLVILSILVTTSFDSLLSTWKIVAVSWIVYAVMSITALMYLKTKYKVNLRDFIKKNSKIFGVALTTANSAVQIKTNFEVLKENLKIDSKLCDFWLPLSHTLFSPGKLPNIVIIVFFGAAFSNATIHLGQLIILTFLAIQLGIASPRGYGGSVAMYTLLMQEFNFDSNTVGIMVLAGTFCVNLGALYGMIVRNCEIYALSRDLKFNNY